MNLAGQQITGIFRLVVMHVIPHFPNARFVAMYVVKSHHLTGCTAVLLAKLPMLMAAKIVHV